MAGRAVISRKQRALASRVENVRVLRIRRDVTALTAPRRILRTAELVAPSPAAAAAPCCAGHANRRVILLRAAYVIRNIARGGDVIELGGRVALAGPCLAAIHRYV